MYNYFNQAFRYLSRNKGYVINSAAGLGLSLTLIILLSAYLHTEQNVDALHENSEHVYRVLRSNECTFSPPFGNYLMDNFEELEAYCRTFCLEAVLETENNLVRTERCFYADETFFEMFSLPLKYGNPGNVLSTKNNLLVSASYADILFPNENPIGKKVRFNDRLDYVVSGIFEDFTSNTHFKPVDVILPYNAMGDFMAGSEFMNQFDWSFMMPALYVQSQKPIENSKLKAVVADLRSWYWPFQNDPNAKLHFQPLKDVYLNKATYDYVYNVRSGNENLLRLTGFIILAVCFIASVNFINLSISKANLRKRELSVKRINGANKSNVALNFIAEQLLMNIVALLFMVVLLMLAMPFFNTLLSYNLHIASLLQQGYAIKTMLAFSILSIVIGTLVLIMVVNKQYTNGMLLKSKSKEVNSVQKGLVVLQFSTSVVLIVFMLLIIKQKQFIANYNLGFNANETLFIKLNRDFKGRAPVFKGELKKLAGVNSVSLCNGMPGVGIYNLRFEQNGKAKSIDMFNIDADYFKTMNIAVPTNFPLTNDACWINESAAVAMEYSEEVGTVTFEEFNQERTLSVAGVLPDMHFHSLYQSTNPTIFTKVNTNEFIDYVLVQVSTSELTMLLNELKAVYTKFSARFPFDYAFVNERMNQAYEKETKTLKLVTCFALFGIVLSVMGMLSIALLVINNKTKEIGIRKVNGAKTAELLQMLVHDFVKWVVLACVIAAPIAYVLAQQWLNTFAYRTTISWWLFALAGLGVILIALLSVSYQSYKAANRNPVEALRYE